MGEKADEIGLKECAARLRVSTDTVRRDVKRGKIRVHRVGRRMTFIWAEVLKDTEQREGKTWTL